MLRNFACNMRLQYDNVCTMPNWKLFQNVYFSEWQAHHANLKHVLGWHMFQNGTQHKYTGLNFSNLRIQVLFQILLYACKLACGCHFHKVVLHIFVLGWFWNFQIQIQLIFVMFILMVVITIICLSKKKNVVLPHYYNTSLGICTAACHLQHAHHSSTIYTFNAFSVSSLKIFFEIK